MIYAKDIFLGVNLKKEKGQVLKSFLYFIKKNKAITITVALCVALMIFDFILIYGFINILKML